jgi:phage major head subunit gpT-like protein
VVAEGAAYQNAAWGNEREVYAAAKRGNIVAVSTEAIINDDLRAILQIPRRLARAAYVTLNELVFGLFTSNQQMSDGSTVFDTGGIGGQASHGNRGTAALSADAVGAAVTTTMKQTNSAGKRINLKPRYLLVPADLYFAAQAICQQVPG